ncbi:MAG TPA: DUF1801 domain-containing protein [Amnibacterium sp.]|jgi:uncharacterized protein YdhG (YjbR/CyaY superfamily)|uniref:iron chaperone n=1 Tax=Amnibacterium sp. TaxID=1872496 RepID=UPI002F93769A
MAEASSTESGKFDGLTADERAALKERTAELKAQAKRAKAADKAQQDEAELLAKIAELPDADRVIGERLHAMVKEEAPQLAPRLWYGMPAYAKDGAVLCFFQAASKFDSRYATLGFNAGARLDDGPMWPTSYALLELGDDEEQRIRELLRRAAG